MRKVVAYTLVSVDGVAESPEQFLLEFDEVMEANLGEVIATQDTVLLGRRMYDEWSAHWPKSDDQPFADFINTVQKYVATATPLTREWTNAEPVRGPVEDFVRTLKAGDGGDIGIHGSLSLTRSLLAAGLVDEVRLLVAPRVVGTGRRLFEDDTGYPLELVRSVGSPSGSLLVHYRVVTGD
ncbi:dihydrofolate reductase family protein [Nocardioides panacis]|uniref:Dihydrofolate reductase family protein n=1 Tax=Nocardioides panacis TaxID=2849501 RepID=A0A975SWP2_9ACTN|nr:dihydrofolate reductase family protein [Nocardioides panacis]QWZ07304.1 dihydrofolate reductase family protein [Nocardioides panacis]